MNPRRSALLALLLFLALTVAATVVSGVRSGPGQGTAPVVLQFAGYLAGLVAAVLLLLPARSGPGSTGGATRTAGAVLLGALLLLTATEVVDLVDGAGANIAAGLVRLVALVVAAGVTARLAAATFALRRGRSS